jgi:hypothetical protein
MVAQEAKKVLNKVAAEDPPLGKGGAQKNDRVAVVWDLPKLFARGLLL